MTWKAWGVCACLIASACGSSEAPSAPSATQVNERVADEAAIRYALFRYEMSHNLSAAQETASIYFLSIDEGDPTTTFLDGFRGSARPLRPASQFKIGDGVMLRVDQIRWLDSNSVEVKGGYYEGLESASGNTYRLERKSGAWDVVADEMNWIS